MKNKHIIWLKVVAWVVCLISLGDLLYRYFTQNLSANPIEFVTNETGQTALKLLIASLAITPMRKLSGWNWLIRFRRLLGLFAFFYAFLHLTTFVVLDKFFDWQEMLRDVTKRPFITVGVLSFVLMVPLAVTSMAWAIRKMGGKNWNLLHRLAYASAVLGVIHFWWKVKADITEPATFGAILAILLIYRIVVWSRSRLKAGAGTAAKAALASE
ncbi:MAG: sulfoxide reductase heme-binding subunit YedZ [Acidobacteriales bacterium]|nr:sulfoxide reductase heme-binding subunit YedZ [Terriglobales bacterium]